MKALAILAAYAAFIVVLVVVIAPRVVVRLWVGHNGTVHFHASFMAYVLAAALICAFSNGATKRDVRQVVQEELKERNI